MKRFLGMALMAVVVFSLGRLGWAGDGAEAVLDKGIKALGGAEKLGAIKGATWKVKGKIRFGGNESDFQSTVTVHGPNHYRSEFEGMFGDNKIRGVTVVSGDKGWRKFGDNNMELDKERLANEKRVVYLQLIPMTLMPLKGKGFKVESAGADKVEGKAAAVLKVTGPDGKDFKLYLDQANGIPVKLVGNVVGFTGEEVIQETTFANYKDFQGIKKATKLEIKRDGETFMEQEISEFRLLEKVDAKLFTEPD
jgi:hypothetical protein